MDTYCLITCVFLSGEYFEIHKKYEARYQCDQNVIKADKTDT
jgi:hypothetical protein